MISSTYRFLINIRRGLSIVLIGSLVFTHSYGQTTEVVILEKQEIARLRQQVQVNSDFHQLSDSILALADLALQSNPRPLPVIYYEGLLDSDPRRIDTQISLNDMDHVANLIYAGYLTDDQEVIVKLIEFVSAWSQTYVPTGNTINENKFIALFWAYELHKGHFSPQERNTMEQWIGAIAQLQMDRPSTPNNNWQAKRMKIIGLAGIILDSDQLQQFAIEGFRKFIGSAYYIDGTSHDLKQRDALHYHVSGLKPCLSAFVNLSKFNGAFSMYELEGELGGSIKKSVDYVVPYARGQKQHKEWVNTKVALDKKRAEAGLAKYQPGMLFDPQKSREMFEWAAYFDPALFEVVSLLDGGRSSWIASLNRPAIRN